MYVYATSRLSRIAACLQLNIDVRTAKKAKYPPTHDADKHSPSFPTAPSVADTLRSGSVLEQILADYNEAKLMPKQHQRTMMDLMTPEEKVRN